MNEYEGLTATELLAIAEPDHANLHALRTQAMAARRYVIELGEASDMLTDLAGQAETELSGHFAESFVTNIADLVENLGVYGYKVHQQSWVVDAVADEAESLYTDLKQYQADREASKAEIGQLSPSQAALVDEMENTIARQRMQDATDYYMERVGQLEPEEEVEDEPQLQSAAAPAIAPAPVASVAPSPGAGTPVGGTVPITPSPPVPGAPTHGGTSPQQPHPARPTLPRAATPPPGTPPRPAIPPARRATTPPVIGHRATKPPARTTGVRAVRSIHPPVIGERTTPTPARQPVDWRPVRRGPLGYTDQVLGRPRDLGVSTKPFHRSPSTPSGDALNRPVVGAPKETTTPPKSNESTEDMWAVATPTVDSIIGARRPPAAQVYHPGPVALAHGKDHALAVSPVRRGETTGSGLAERLTRVTVQSVTEDRTVAARLNGTGDDLSFTFGPIGTDMGALAQAVRKAMVAALRGRDVAAARVVGASEEATPDPNDPLAAVDVEARSRLGYVHIRWQGLRNITVAIDARAQDRLSGEQLLSEVTHAATTVLRRHREHLIELNRRLVEAADTKEPS